MNIKINLHEKKFVKPHYYVVDFYRFLDSIPDQVREVIQAENGSKFMTVAHRTIFLN